MSFLWGLDLGGTKIEGAILSEERLAEPICRVRVPTEADQGYEHIVDQIARLVAEMEKQSGLLRPESIGIGTPGTTDPMTGRLKNSNTTVLNGQPLADCTRQALRVNVILANDANCFALAEATMGAAIGAPVVFGVIMGTGVGGGLVVNGHVLGGAQGIAGEWGHNVLEPEGVLCYCGKIGCVETVLSGPALERYYAAEAGLHRSLKEIAHREESGGDPAAAATMQRLCDKFGEALSVVVNIVDPDVIVVGGGVGNIDALYDQGQAALEKWVFNTHLGTRLVRPLLGDSAGVFGAAMLTRR